jgi:hypothetical protein
MFGWRTFFILAAVFNFAAGLPLLLAPDVMLSTLGVAVPGDLLFHRMTGLLVVCFGVVYYFVAQDLARYRPLVWLGVAGKAGVVALFGQAFAAGFVPAQAFAVALGDLLFAAGFLVFVLSYKGERA